MRHRIRKHLPSAAIVSGLVLLALLVQGPPAMAQPATARDDDAALDARYAQQTLRVNVWVDKGADEVYARGEELQVTLQTNEDAYLVVYHVDVNGRVSVLWPTSRYDDGFVFGQHEYRLPTGDGRRLRVAEAEGVGYVNALASRYPYDLRDLAVDFHHEPQQPALDYYVTGDPFLAMNEVNYAITGLEDPSEYVVSNYASYYVHRAVDHPRYLCSQCHTDDELARGPYDSECTVTIRYDYGWANDWWDRYGYYPPYYYPVYIYVDPWTGSPWVNYWYRPWYYWPHSSWYHWNYACYDWHHSPYWRWDGHDDYRPGPRRYRPLDKTDLARGGSRDGVNSRSGRVTDAAPEQTRLTAMKERTVITDRRRVDDRAEARDRDLTAGGRTVRNVTPVERPGSKFTRSDEGRSGAGLRVPADRNGGDRDQNLRRGESTRTGGNDPSRLTPSTRRGDRSADDRLPDRRSSGVRSPDNRAPDGRTPGRSGDAVRIRPVEPREGSAPTWSGRRSTPPRANEPARPAERPSGGPRGKVEKAPSRNDSGRAVAPPPPPSRGGEGSGRSSGDAGRSDNSGRGSSGGGDRGSSGGGDRGSSGGGDRGSGGGGRTRGGR